MSERAPSDFTSLQRKILHASAVKSDLSRSDIASELDCSPSYVGDVLRQYDGALESIQEIGQVDYLVSFAHPYSILLPESALDEVLLSVGDAMELTFEIDGEERTTHGRVGQYEGGMLSRSSEEMQARTFGCYQTTEALAAHGETLFDQFSTVDGRADLPTDREFRTFLQAVQDELSDCMGDGVGLVIGVGILEILHGKRDPDNLVSSPHFNLEREQFVKYVTGDQPELLNGHLYLDSISEPDDVYFTYYGESFDDSQLESLRERILDYELFASSWNYSLPGYQGVVGPTTTEPTTEVVRVRDESLHIVEGTRRNVRYSSQIEGNDPEELNVENILEAIQAANPEFESLATNTRYAETDGDLPLRPSADNIYFLFDQVTLVLTAHDDHISWLSPTQIEPIEKIISAINHIIGDQLGWSDPDLSTHNQHQPQYIRDADWTFDTNTLYHDHNGNRPTSILHTIFSELFFHNSTVHIPWPVLFEMNKHPESGSASEATNKQGFENLSILRTLEQLEYLTLDVQTPPPDIEIDLSNGDVADMQVLAYAEEHDSRLVSGDQSLVDIARLSETPTVDIKHLDSLASTTEDDSGLEVVLSKIGAALHTKKEILSSLSEVLDQSSTIPEAETSSHSRSDPEGILGRKESNGEILPYIQADSGELCYAPCEEATFVPTKAALEHLSSYLDEADEYLTDDLLTQITAGLHSIHDSKIPAITLLVPSEYVVEMSISESAPSEFNQGLVKLTSAKNVKYNSTPAIQNDMNIQSLAPQSGEKSSDTEELLSWRDYLAVCCTKNHESAKLLVTNTEDGLWKFSKLLGIEAVSIDPKGGEEREDS